MLKHETTCSPKRHEAKLNNKKLNMVCFILRKSPIISDKVESPSVTMENCFNQDLHVHCQKSREIFSKSTHNHINQRKNT